MFPLDEEVPVVVDEETEDTLEFALDPLTSLRAEASAEAIACRGHDHMLAVARGR